MAGLKLGFSAIRELGKAIAGTTETRQQTKKAIVREVTDGGAVVEVAGSGVLTPVESSAATYGVGDVVTVSNRGGKLHIDGDVSAPSVGAGYVRKTVQPVAQAVAEAAQTAAEGVKAGADAQKAADEAKATANATDQHFWTDAIGVHVTEQTQEDWQTAQTGGNILINSLGLLLRIALNNLVSIARSAIAFYDGAGNQASNIVARFGSDGAQIGLTDESHLSLDYRSMQLVDKEGDTYFHVSDLRMEDGSIVAEFTGNGTTTDYVLPVHPYSPSDGTNTSLTIDGVAKTYGTGGGDYMLADTPVFGILLLETPAAAGASIVLRYKPTESVNPKALTFGSRDANMSGMGAFSATFGSSCAAMSDNTIALNKGTIAYTPNQTAVGTYNEIDDNGKYALIIGNGTADNARSNAFAVDWDGNVEAAGGVTVNGHSSPIGSVRSNTKNSISRSGTAIDTMTNGASVTLTAGVWVVCGYWAFNSGAVVADGRSMQVALGTSGATDYYERVRVAAHNSAWATLECSCIVSATSSGVTVYVKGAASAAQNSARLDNSHIKAVRIV